MPLLEVISGALEVGRDVWVLGKKSCDLEIDQDAMVSGVGLARDGKSGAWRVLCVTDVDVLLAVNGA